MLAFRSKQPVSGANAARPLLQPKRTLHRLLAGLALMAIGACTEMPHTDGDRARLFDGISTPRNRDNVDISIHRYPVTAWGKCLEMLMEKRPFLAALSVVTISPIHACARLPRDRHLKPGQKPWCVVAVPNGEPETLEHEIRHCEGWDHPRHIDDATDHAEDATAGKVATH